MTTTKSDINLNSSRAKSPRVGAACANRRAAPARLHSGGGGGFVEAADHPVAEKTGAALAHSHSAAAHPNCGILGASIFGGGRRAPEAAD